MSKKNVSDLAAALCPQQTQSCAQYKEQLSVFEKDLPKPLGKKTHARYQDVLVKAAKIVAFAWEKYGIEDNIIHQKKSLKEKEDVREVKVAALKVLQALETALKRDESQLLAADILIAALESPNEREIYPEQLFCILGNSNLKAMNEQDYCLAEEQIRKISKALGELKTEIEKIPKDCGTKAITKEYQNLQNNFLNSSRDFGVTTDKKRTR